MEDKILVFVLGAPGAGKGTQCEMVEKEFGWSHISAGDLLRAQVAAGTEAGKQAEKIMKEGQMVPASMIIGLLKEAINNGEHTKILIDGFPRVLDQLGEFEQQVRPCNRALFYNVAEETALERLRKRAQNSGRADDNEETIHKRFVVFQDESLPVADALRGEGRLVEIDAAAPAEEVYAHTKRIIQELEQEQQNKNQPAAEAVEAATDDVPNAAPAVEAVAAVLSADGAAAAGVRAEGSQASAAVPEQAAEADGPLDPSAAPEQEQSATAAADDGAEQSRSSLPAAEDSAAEPAAAGDHEMVSPAAEASGMSAAAAAADGAAAEDSAAAQLSAAGDGAEQLGKTQSQVEVPAAAAAASPAAAGVSDLQIDLAGIRTPIVICGPSGVGKGTLINKLMTQYPDKFGFSVSHTTRSPRPGEQHGVHYNFTDIPSMKDQVAAGLFLEHAEVHGNMYGTSLAAVANVSNMGKHCVLDIDVQGAQQVKASALGHLCLFIFIAPPSHEELERRLRNRGTESEEKVLQRLANAEAEISKGQEPGVFDNILVNGDLDVAYQQLQQLINQKVPGLLPEVTAVSSAQPPAAAAPAVEAAAEAAASSNATTHPPAAQPVVMANGSVLAQQAVAAAAAAGGTSTLLDFGFGASAGPAVAVKGMPVRQYMDVTVIPVLREGLKALNVARPDDPLQYLADFLVAHKPATH